MSIPKRQGKDAFIIMCLLGVIYVGISIASSEDYINDWVGDSIKLGIIVILCIVGYLSGREFFHFTKTKSVFLVAMFFLIMLHITELTEEFTIFQPLPLFGEVTAAKRAFETILMIGSICILLGGIYLSVFEINRAKKQLDADVRFLETTARIDRIIRQTDDLEQMMQHVLQTVLSVFGCHRAFLLQPCDPDCEHWHIQTECTKSRVVPLFTPKIF